ncbi:DUF4132 domain-containing protein [Polyangium jinanense]|uniref:DUF4132 domain-containing protein n=1 Tax=Polyangium jinanense TaxID=2829994 RepID=A0A9X4ATX5_9BACT|nr:DUF4132 domain-containing protein [Polyangium jinanense]MDC3957225.1 DUF4132 domain-containing protein [Polyangium jinanense]MDC3982627.1 DUF4132 domain-containing protein [Polyangium jinanense]
MNAPAPAPDHEAVFLVRLRSLVSAVRVLEVRADAWPARRVVEEHEGYFAEGALFLRFEPRKEVPFPLRLHGERPEDLAHHERVRRASRVFLRATALAEARPRRAEQAFQSLEALFEEIGPDAAASMWLEAARTFLALGDEEHATRLLRRLARLARRAPVSAALLVAVVSSPCHGKTLPGELVDVAAEHAGPDAGLSLRLGVLRRLLEAGSDVPPGTMAALTNAAQASADRAAAASRIDAALLGCFDLPGTWAPAGEASLVRARLQALWALSHASGDHGSSVRGCLASALRATLDGLDTARLAAVLDTLLPASPSDDTSLLLDVTVRLLGTLAREANPLAEDTCIRVLLRLAEIASTNFLEQVDDICRALADAFDKPTSRPLLAALLADLDASARRVLSEELDRAADSRLGPAETTPPPRSGTRTNRVRSLARWLPAPLVTATLAALAASSADAASAAVAASPALAFIWAFRLIGLAQDERTSLDLAEDALSLAEVLAQHIDPHLVTASTIAAADPTLHLAHPDPAALLRGVALSRASLADRGVLRPERWPAPALPGLSDPRDARFVLLAWALSSLDAHEAGTHHLAFARIADATPLVRAGAGRLLPSPLALRGVSPSLTRLAATNLLRIPTADEPSLRDVVLLCSPRDLAEAFARDVGVSPRLLAEAPPLVPTNLDPSPPLVPRDLPLPDADPARLLAALFPRRTSLDPAPIPTRDPALPLSPVIAGHVVSLGPRGELIVTAEGASSPLRRVPSAVRKDERYRALVRGRRAERARRHEAARLLEDRMIRAAPVTADEIAWLLDDPLHASLLRHLVLATRPRDPGPPRDLALLWTWDHARGLGVVPLDYDARWIGWTDVELVHPARLPDVGAWRALTNDLGVKQDLPQLFRDLRGVPDDELDRTESHALARRLVDAAALRRALVDEGFSTGSGLATRNFVHQPSSSTVTAWFDPGRPPWPRDAAFSGPFGFCDPKGDPLPFTAIPRPLVCEARASIDRALARAAPRAR